jgi:hypothetical protein
MGVPTQHMCWSLGGKLSFKELDLRDPCNVATLSRRALRTESLAEKLRRLQSFDEQMELGPGKTTGFMVLIGPSSSMSTSASQRAAMDCGMYLSTRSSLERQSAEALLPVCWGSMAPRLEYRYHGVCRRVAYLQLW